MDYALAHLTRLNEVIIMDISKLTREVQETRGAIESAKATLAGVAHAIRQYKTDQVALDKLADDLDAAQNELAAAIVDVNTAPAETAAGDGSVPVSGVGETPADDDTGKDVA